MNYINIIGVVFPLLFSFCYIPQILEMYKTKSANGLSTTMLIMVILAYILASIYTALKIGFDIALVMNYGLGLISAILTLALKIYYGQIDKGGN